MADELLGDFNVGGRIVEVNPKYARYGWNEYYENEEWWTTAPANPTKNPRPVDFLK
ncbi:hypothetical protein [Hymenobacter cellulosilyticus]|uniref:Uncharacterized protein n=1 Tax=Hymenobacter cellulosilyticus TaxID=2932248 RepID=A0A8T9Q5L5_9BACT|nr:hypothetical protein [Hymenobacter cellulosilyticus]UOQ71238.1 hypothetical protein MUN79_21690 [Hymenobacter cellulosilyticus]